MRRGTLAKCGEIGYYRIATLCLFSIQLYIMQNPQTITMVNATSHYGDPSTCVRSVYQALSPPPLEGPGYEAMHDGASLDIVY